MSNLLLRFKAPDFPAHLYFEGNFVDKDGTEQQMFYQSFWTALKVQGHLTAEILICLQAYILSGQTAISAL